MPKVAKGPLPVFEAIPGRQEARQAARTGVRRGLVVGVASAAVLGLLLARTFRAPTLDEGSAQTAGAAAHAPAPLPAPVITPEPVAPVGAVPVAPAGWEQPNPYASPAGLPQPALILGAPPAGSRPAPPVEPARGDSKPASYTDADLARVRTEAEPAPEARPVSVSAPAPVRSPAKEEARETRLRERRDAVRAAQQRADEAQGTVDDIRREARENDDDGLQEELSDALSDLKSAQRDLAHARRKLQELEDQARPVLPPR